MHRTRVLSWFTGKARENASHALDLLAVSEAQGSWVPKASRMVPAALGKANKAINLGREFEGELEKIGNYETPSHQRGFEVSMILRFGQYARARGGEPVDFDTIAANAPSPACANAVKEAKRFQREFDAIARLCRRLDATRPKPVFTNLGISPTVTKTLAGLGFHGADQAKVEVCPIRWETVERTRGHNKLCKEGACVQGCSNGKKYWVQVGHLEWPEGTQHDCSRFADINTGRGRFEQCHACGHGIRNPWNWVPLVITSGVGAKYSWWVGTDCARTLFGIKVTGEVELVGGKGS